MKSLVFFAGLLLAFNAFAQPEARFELSGITAAEVEVWRFDFEQEDYVPLATITVEEGKPVNFEDNFREPALYQFRFGPEQRVTVAAEKAGLFQLAQNETFELQSEAGTIADFGQTIQQLSDHYFSELKVAYEAAVEKQDMEKLAVLEKQKDELLIQFIEAMEAAVRLMGPSAEAYQALTYFDAHKNFGFLAEMAEAFEKQYPQAGMAKALKRRVERAALVQKGATAPDFSTVDISSENVALADYRGSYVLVDFWASWCLACRAENPKLVALYEKLHAQGFDILSISLDEKAEQWKQAITKDRLSWRQVRDADGALASLYLVSSLPANFLLDKEGKIVAKNVTADQLEELLGELLN
ncbi:MAG: TlpA family protein disulfide reductase [Lewinellaceae bacterium]|nr:TlpA family protein disulfide reductase [Phaeodactylibacter sp.]MCB9037998.1 TlpA family protein disulfide reductase [Lewinellaceae bacterium]